MPKIAKPDLSKSGLLQRFEILLLIPNDKSDSFDQNITDLIYTLRESFEEIKTVFYKNDDLSEKNDKMVIEILALDEDFLKCDKFFHEKVPLWRSQFGEEKIVVLSTNMLNWA